ncbi:hypothetical protein PPYC2_21690 [Paenibacillus polymyxa]|uniref:hypothetical protein n=1 Tax=Paenibacillus polymyxa TaxID=1406 RepID=UPI0008FB3625|nr:hypothetical protein [Paenibacillus polymyxa]APB77398.1 hypothetical protein PPYC2_21690 [Paenibacillus polymyxa]
MSIKTTFNYNGKKYAVGEGRFWIYNENDESRIFPIAELFIDVIRDPLSHQIVKVIIILPGGDTLTFTETLGLTEFIDSVQEEQAKAKK